MKSCPVCHAVYDDSMNYCLEHGTTLIDSRAEDLKELTNRDTAQFSGSAVNPYSKETGKNFGTTGNVTAARSDGKGFTLLLIGIGALVLLLAAGVVVGGYYIIQRSSSESNKNVALPTPRTVKTPLPKPELAQIRVDLTEDTATSQYGWKFRKALVTNQSTEIIPAPTVGFVYFKGDVRVDSTSEKVGIDFMRPGQTLPVWVRTDIGKDFDRITADTGESNKVAAKPADEIFAKVKVLEEKMTIASGTSLVNFKRVVEPYYKVSGTIENISNDKTSPKVFAIFYDADKSVVGFGSNSVDPLDANEKARFDISVSRNSIYGEAASYELVIFTR